MKNKNMIGAAVLAVVAVIVVLSVNPPKAFNGPAGEQRDSFPEFEPDGLNLDLPLSNSPKDRAWALFQKYLSYNKSKDLEGVRSTVYKLSPVCEDPKLAIDCESRMGAAYRYGSALNKEDFVNLWEDSRQMILATDYNINEDESSIGRNRAIIFFLKDEAGNMKMLSFSPFQGSTVRKGAASREELLDRLLTYTEDKDADGIAGYYEECIPAGTKDSCVPTDPNIRDTDGDGLWDGTENYTG